MTCRWADEREPEQAREEGAAEAARDYEAGAAGDADGGGRGNNKRRRKSSAEQSGEDLFFAREALQGRLPKYVELLKFKVRARGFFFLVIGVASHGVNWPLSWSGTCCISPSTPI
jgi:hypothetical protein